jgi:transposase
MACARSARNGSSPTGDAAGGRGGGCERGRTCGGTRRGLDHRKSFERKRPARKPFPEHLPGERIVIAAPQCCSSSGSTKLSKLGEDVTETPKVVPRQWKVIQTVRERFSCRECETITQPPAPFHVTPCGFAGPSLLAVILFEKFGQHQPLNRQSERYAREGVELSLSTLADQVGACAAALRPLHALIEAHVLATERLHGDDSVLRRHAERTAVMV